MLKKHVLGSFNLNNSEMHRLSFEDIFLGNTRHLHVYEKNEPTLGSSGGEGGVRYCPLAHSLLKEVDITLTFKYFAH